MYPNAFHTRENYGDSNPQYFKLDQTCAAANRNRLMNLRSSYDQQTVPAYNQLAENTLTYPSINVNKSPQLHPFNGYGSNGFRTKKANTWPINHLGRYGSSGLALSLQPPPRPTFQRQNFQGHRRTLPPAAAPLRENFEKSTLKGLEVDLFFRDGCGYCQLAKKLLNETGELKNVTLKDVTDPKYAQEAKQRQLGGGVPAYYSNANNTKAVGHHKTIDLLVKALSS